MPIIDKDKKNAYQRKYFAKGGPGHAKQTERIRVRRASLRKWLREYKTELHCNRCPENHPSCLDFHHKDPKEKELLLSKVVAAGWGKAKILAEMEKCEVLCANCHRKEHA